VKAWPFLNVEPNQVSAETLANWQEKKSRLEAELAEIPKLLEEMSKMRQRLEDLEKKK